MLGAGVFLLLLGTATGELGTMDAAAFSLESIAAWLYLAVFGTLVAFTAYAWLLRNAPISQVVTHQYVNPLVAIALGALLLGEQITLLAGVGAALIVGSVFVAVRQERRPGEPAAASNRLAGSDASLAERGPVEQYGSTGRRLERREPRGAAPEAGSAGREAQPVRAR
jgi:uncharacterized membrane protein